MFEKQEKSMAGDGQVGFTQKFFGPWKEKAAAGAQLSTCSAGNLHAGL